MKKTILLMTGIAALGWMTCVAQPANLSPGLQEIVKLTQAHMSDDVVIAYIRNSGAGFSLSADDILYLNSQGVSQPVISELLHSKATAAPTPLPPATTTPTPAPVTAPPPSVPPPTVAEGGAIVQPSTPPPTIAAGPEQPPPDSEVNLAYFQTRLTPAGAWVEVPGYGTCWQPNVAAQDPNWRPYMDSGHWVYTEDGWTWDSDYAWGEVAFHYGRWFHDWRAGWVWLPGYNWGPAWVAWRHAEGVGFCGWAPLPPEARFEVGVGLTFGGRVVVDSDFGLAPAAFVFVPFDHFWAPDFRVWIAPQARVDVLFHASIVVNDYRFDGGHFVVGGIGRDRMAVLTHHEIPIGRVEIHDERLARARDFQRVRAEEVRHEIGHDAAVHEREDIHRDVRQVDTAHHADAVRRMDSHQPTRGVPSGRGDGRDERRDGNNNGR